MDSIEVTPVEAPIDALVRPPGSKSFTNRALVVAALAEGTSQLVDPLVADDTVVMRAGLRRFGVEIDDRSDIWSVTGLNGRFGAPTGPIDVGASGTTGRFLTAAAALSDGPTIIDGTPRMRERPIAHLTDALTALGADVMSHNGCPPVELTPSPLHGGVVDVDMSASSQFLSAMLLIAPAVGEEVTLRIAGPDPVSRTYLTSTLEVMTAFGADVAVGDDGAAFHVQPTGYRATEYRIEPDASASAYPLAAAAVTGGRVSIAGIPRRSTQPDLALVDALVAMGCSVERTDVALTLIGPSDGLRPIDIDMSGAPDASLALAVVAAFASGPSHLHGLRTLRLKETDRLAALHTELTRIGARPEIEGDSLSITPGPLRGANIDTYDDHRMAMSFAIAGLVVPGMVINDPGCVAKTWPTFFDDLGAMSSSRVA